MVRRTAFWHVGAGILHVGAVTRGPQHNCCTGRHVRVGMPDLDYPPWIYYHNLSTSSGHLGERTGFLADILSTLASDMDWTLEWVSVCSSNFSYQECLRSKIEHGVIDVGFATLYDPAFDSTSVAFAQAIVQEPMQGVVIKSREERGVWQMFTPFESEVWIALVLCVVVATLLIIANEAFHAKKRGDMPGIRFTWIAVYHAWATILGGEDYEWVGMSGRLFRLGLLLLVLITNATYTANLAAFLTAPAFTLGGPSTMDELMTATACVPNPSFASHVADFVGEVVTPPLELHLGQDPLVGFNFCFEKLQSGDVDITIDLQATAHQYVLQQCLDLAEVPAIAFAPQSLGFFFSLREGEFARRFSIAESHLQTTKEYQNIVAKHLAKGQACEEGGEEDMDSEERQITLAHMSGLFFIYVCIAVLALAVGCCQRIGRPHHGEEEPSIATTDHEKIAELADKMEIVAAVIQKIDERTAPMSKREDPIADV